MTLFRTGDGEDESLAVFSFVAPNQLWFRRVVVQMLSLACDPNRWEKQGDASIDFATNYATNALNSLVIDELEPEE